MSGYQGPLSSPWAFPLPKTVADVRSLSERPPEGVEKPFTVEAFLRYLVGVWVLRTAGAVNQKVGGVGLVFDPDGRWATLFEADGELCRATGWDAEGTWAALDTSLMNGPGHFQLNMTVDGGGGMTIADPTFATSLPLMRLRGHMGPSPSNLEYVKLDQAISALPTKPASDLRAAEEPPTVPAPYGALSPNPGPVSFFDDFRPYRGMPRPWTEPKPWRGPPPGWAPGSVPWYLVVLRSADVHAAVANVEAFRTGVCFTTVARFRPGAVSEGYLFENYLWKLPEGPRLGVRFADGRKAMFDPEARSESRPPTDPFLARRGGGFVEAESEGSVWLECRRDVWLWPLPPPGQLSFVTAWPEKGIAETTTTVEATELIDAASRSEQLWEAPAGDAS